MARKKADPISDQFKCVNTRELTALSTRLLREQGYFEGPSTTKDAIAVRKIVAKDIDALKAAGMYEYFYAMYMMFNACQSDHLLLAVDDAMYQDSRLASLLGMTTAGVSPVSKKKARRASYAPAPLYCAEGFRHRILRCIVKKIELKYRTHMVIAYTDPKDIPGSSFGVMFADEMMNNHDGLVEYKGLARYFYFPHEARDVMSDMVCFFIRETRSLNVYANSMYLTQVNMSEDQYKNMFPTEWHASTIRDARTNEEFQSAVEDASRHNELVLLPHVNLSKAKTWVTNAYGQRSIILGLSDIDGIDIDDAKSIIQERLQYGTFLSREDFITRCRGRVLSDYQLTQVTRSGAACIDDDIYMQRNFQYNSTLYSHVYVPSQYIMMSDDTLLG